MLYNPELLKIAEWILTNNEEEAEKAAFAPPPPSPEQQQAQQGQGAAPGQPMDPSQMGQPQPQPDPSQGGMGGGMSGMDPTGEAMLRKIIKEELMANGGMGAAGGGGAGKGGVVKPDLNTIAMDVFQIKKLISNLYHAQDMPLPEDILDGPNRDPSTGLPTPPGAPGSTSDPSKQPAQQEQPQSAIQPIQPMQGASLSGPPKQAEDYSIGVGFGNQAMFDTKVVSRAAALSSILKRIKSK